MQQPNANEKAGKRNRSVRKLYRRARIPKESRDLDYILSNKGQLTERQATLLNLLAERGYMTIDHILHLMPELADNKNSTLSATRLINKLVKYYLVDRASYQYVTQWDGTEKRTTVIALGEIGSQAVSFYRHRTRIRYENGKPILSRKAHHILQVNHMEIVFREVIAEMGFELVKDDKGKDVWLCECGNRVIGPDADLNPDAYTAIRDSKTGKIYHLLFEYDTGEEDRNYKNHFPTLTATFDKYVALKKSDEWYEKPAVQIVENPFPLFFFVTEEKKRFPKVRYLLNERGLDFAACLRHEFADELRMVLSKLRSGEHVTG
ncbi:hypothetical protein [Laceyella putida]|uniref:Replication-relaxation n=1 Tax=Laceyella putida TaxID=110101 RepID=A0ABW2RQ45_9BACL